MEQRRIRCVTCVNICINGPIRVLQEWKEAAATLDEYLGFDDWKKIDEDAFYDWKLVRKVKKICSQRAH